jgi:uncharacterized protein YbjT (DUF2867 family)
MIAVVGAAGYQGQLIARRLRDHLDDVRLVDRRAAALHDVARRRR